MRFITTALLYVSFLLSPLAALAESGDAEGTIVSVDTNALALKLNDGKTYVAPSEFNFEGLEKGVKVIVYYTVVEGKRVIDDLEVVQ